MIDRALEHYLNLADSYYHAAQMDQARDTYQEALRLAQAHLDAGHIEQALEHLDKLGDLQLEAGRAQDAKATIRAIIALHPPNIVAYQQLLDQLESGQ